MYKYMHTSAGLTVIIRGRPYSISSAQPDFKAVLDLVLGGAPEELVLGRINSRKDMVMALLRKQLTDNLEYREGLIFYRGEVLRTSVAKHMIEMIGRCEDITAISNFTEKVMQNPIKAVYEELYEFLAVGKIPITPDGDFLVYKAVRPDYKDIHSGRFMNSVGSVCTMPFTEVDPDRQRTCSYGLHVCSYAYLPHFANANGHVMLCRVNPKDVVAVPADYNNTKMRVARYEVVGEVTSYYKEGLDVLGTGPGVVEQRFEVHYADDTSLDEVYDTYYTLEEAKHQADDIREGTGIVWVVDTRTKEVVYKA